MTVRQLLDQLGYDSHADHDANIRDALQRLVRYEAQTDQTLRDLASSFKKLLTPQQLAELVTALDVDEPLRAFFAYVQVHDVL